MFYVLIFMTEKHKQFSQSFCTDTTSWDLGVDPGAIYN